MRKFLTQFKDAVIFLSLYLFSTSLVVAFLFYLQMMILAPKIERNISQELVDLRCDLDTYEAISSEIDSSILNHHRILNLMGDPDSVAIMQDTAIRIHDKQIQEIITYLQKAK